MTNQMNANRRSFIRSALVLSVTGAWLPQISRAAAPRDNPLRGLNLGWTDKLKWDAVLDLTTLPGRHEFWDERLEQAQQRLSAGGVIFFPSGTYRFQNDIKLRPGIILRGEDPGVASAQEERFTPPS